MLNHDRPNGSPSIAREFFFRGILQTILFKWVKSRWMAIVAAGILFGLAHSDQPQVIPAITAFGIILGIIYERRGSLVGPIVAQRLSMRIRCCG